VQGYFQHVEVTYNRHSTCWQLYFAFCMENMTWKYSTFWQHLKQSIYFSPNSFYCFYYRHVNNHKSKATDTSPFDFLTGQLMTCLSTSIYQFRHVEVDMSRFTGHECTWAQPLEPLTIQLRTSFILCCNSKTNGFGRRIQKTLTRIKNSSTISTRAWTQSVTKLT